MAVAVVVVVAVVVEEAAALLLLHLMMSFPCLQQGRVVVAASAAAAAALVVVVVVVGLLSKALRLARGTKCLVTRPTHLQVRTVQHTHPRQRTWFRQTHARTQQLKCEPLTTDAACMYACLVCLTVYVHREGAPAKVGVADLGIGCDNACSYTWLVCRAWYV